MVRQSGRKFAFSITLPKETVEALELERGDILSVKITVKKRVKERFTKRETEKK